MSILTTDIPNTNFLSPTGFRFILKRAPNVEYFCQAATLPTMTLATAQQATPFVQVPRPGNKIEFEPLEIRFRVDEDMRNYLELYNWITGLGHPQTLSQYANLALRVGDSSQDFTKLDSIVSDATLVILTNQDNANIRLNFEDLFPSSLSPLEFSSMGDDIVFLECACTFYYKLFTVDRNGL